MAFTMSYGVTPPPAPAETIPKVAAPKKPASHRGRKHSSLQAQAQGLFDPALAQRAEAPLPPAATDMPENGATPLALSDEDAAAQTAHGLSPA